MLLMIVNVFHYCLEFSSKIYACNLLFIVTSIERFIYVFVLQKRHPALFLF